MSFPTAAVLFHSRSRMLEDFASVAAAASNRTSHPDPQAYATTTSPNSTRPSSPVPFWILPGASMSINELTREFRQHRISGGSFAHSTTSSEDTFSSSDDGMTFIESPYANLSATTLRSRRQAATRLQSDPAHLRDISALVERMVDRGDQCAVASPSIGPSTSSSASSDIDDDEVRTLDISRRTSTSVTSAYPGKFPVPDVSSLSSGVSKRDRLRKHRDRVKGWSRKK